MRKSHRVFLSGLILAIGEFPQQNRWSFLAAVLSIASALVTSTDAQSEETQPKTAEIATQYAAATEPRLNLRGHVHLSDGRLANAKIFIAAAGPKVGTSPFCPSCYSDCRKSTITDSQGNFEIESLDPQLLFRILVVGQGCKPKFVGKVDPAQKPINVSLEPLDLAQVPPEQIIRGRVIDAKGVPIQRAAVQPFGIRTADGMAMWGWLDGVDPLAVTDSDGNFVISSRKPFASLDLNIEAAGFAKRWFTKVYGGMPPRDLQLTEGAAIRGRVTLSGRPMTNVQVEAVSGELSPDHSPSRFEIGTDAQGRFLFVNLPPKVRYQVYGRMDSLNAYGASQVATVEVSGDGGMNDAGDLVVVPANRIKGRVVLNDGKPIPPKTRLLLCREDTWDAMHVDLDNDGFFNIGGIPNTPVYLEVAVAGYNRSPVNANIDKLNPAGLIVQVDHDITNLVIRLDKGASSKP
jgi:hypothetical protein